MSVSCSSNGRGQGRGDSSIGMSHETILKYSRCKISGQGMGVGVSTIGIGVVGGGHGHCDQASENLKFAFLKTAFLTKNYFRLTKSFIMVTSILLENCEGKDGGTHLFILEQFRPLKQPHNASVPSHTGSKVHKMSKIQVGTKPI